MAHNEQMRHMYVTWTVDVTIVYADSVNRPTCFMIYDLQMKPSDNVIHV